MGRRHVIKQLDDEQFQFVINAIINGATDREISIGFEQQFEAPLAKSSIARWREAAGNELAERYRLARYQARQLLEDLNENEDADKYQVVIRNIEDKLLTATREVIAIDPVKMLQVSLDEQKRRLKARELSIRERELELKLVQAKALDPATLPAKILEQLLAFIDKDPKGLVWFQSNAKKLEEHFRTVLGAAAGT